MDRKSGKKKIQKTAEDKTFDLLEIMDDPTFIVDSQGSLVSHNKAVEKLHETFHNLDKGPVFFELFDGYFCRLLQEHFLEMFKSGKTVSFEAEWNGALYEIRLDPLTRQDASVLTGAVQFKNITERKYLEKILFNNESRLIILNEVSSRIIGGQTAEDVIFFALDKLFEYFPHYRVSCSVLERSGKLRVVRGQQPFVMPDMVDFYTDLGPESKLVKALFNSEFVIVHNVRSDKSLEETAKRAFRISMTEAFLFWPMKFSEDRLYIISFESPEPRQWTMHEMETLKEVCEYLAVAVKTEQADLERRKAELERAEAIYELRRSNADLEQFAYIASHDLQEPLRMVASFLQLLEKRYKHKLDKDADEFIGFAIDGAKRMQLMISDLLVYSRVGTRGQNVARVNLGKVVRDVMSNLRFSIEDSGAEIKTDDLPEILADEFQMKQLFQNLLSNALKFKGERKPEVYISAEDRTDSWLFGIHDNGIGISQEHYENIFALFQRLHPQVLYPGTGIGLSICKRIVERHNGRIWVESELGKGTVFYFTIPIKGWFGESVVNDSTETRGKKVKKPQEMTNGRKKDPHPFN